MRKPNLLRVLSLLSVVVFAVAQAWAGTGTVHTYYVAADEVEWKYTPRGIDNMMGMPFMAARRSTRARPASHWHRLSQSHLPRVHRRHLRQLEAASPDEEYLGALGPVLRGEVGDTIRVIFKNNATHPYSMHPHGVFYNKDSEGAGYADGDFGADKEDDVPPGQTHIYTWEVPERSGPGPNDGSSVVWLYHSHANELRGCRERTDRRHSHQPQRHGRAGRQAQGC